MGRRGKTWGEGPSVDDPGRAGAVRDHTYTTSNGTWQLPKDSEVDAEIARLADRMAAELEITDAERSVVAGTDAAAEAEMHWAEADADAQRDATAPRWDAVYGPDDGIGDEVEDPWIADLEPYDDEAEVEA